MLLTKAILTEAELPRLDNEKTQDYNGAHEMKGWGAVVAVHRDPVSQN